ncbi:SDR family oxidoreductase [Gallaecimonas pentaromativorans]|uniref:Cyclic-di-GMP-binding biofilm dispersal mediator protein n=1 Tax=Gallaecimonas pentaromativorans TaxID=584787 RepID=A0A3N1P9V2_9GAMM|nr:SDR family oxidoreductase [Gallaecimonas pentaromativorans]ROQ24211.1 cyclic-di-GMP-binding biofilm dispersal mediator protein [Gallaecimonas pentaromativorans]
MNTLTAKKALVLGGSRGIGAAIVNRLSAEGAYLTFTYAGSAQAAKALADSTASQAVQVDSSERDQLTAFIDSQGPLDILVINAGTLLMGDPLTLAADDVDRMIDINVRAPYHAAVAAARQMKDGGRIIVIGSVNGDRMPMAGASAYALTKSALQGMVRGLARDLGERGITVNNVQPGPVDTDMNPAEGPFSELMHSFMAIKRHGKPEEIAALVAFLAGPEAGYITGAQHTIDGGFGA